VHAAPAPSKEGIAADGVWAESGAAVPEAGLQSFHIGDHDMSELDRNLSQVSLEGLEPISSSGSEGATLFNEPATAVGELFPGDPGRARADSAGPGRPAEGTRRVRFGRSGKGKGSITRFASGPDVNLDQRRVSEDVDTGVDLRARTQSAANLWKVADDPTPRLRGGTGETEVLNFGLHYHFYICHKVETGRHLASTLHITLQGEQFKCWLDVDTGRGSTGEHGPTENNMRAGVHESACMLLLLTRGVLESEWCGKELQWALDEGKPIICIKDDACKVGHSNHFDFGAELAKAPEHLRVVVTGSDAVAYRAKVRLAQTHVA
jgi:hypothetical protein